MHKCTLHDVECVIAVALLGYVGVYLLTLILTWDYISVIAGG